MEQKAAYALTPGSFLKNEEYKILEVLGQGGFGITYKAEQTSLGRPVAIKEFFMKDFCERQEGNTGVSLGTVNNKDMMQGYLAKFVKEARTISQLENPHIVKIIDIFNANNTAYYVMEYIDGRSVADILSESGPLGESTAINYISQAADALRTVHGSNFMHLDVKPANMMVSSKDGRLVLIDFGLAKRYDVTSHKETSTTPVAISHGYAPLEQYKAGGVSTFSPQADIYSLGASLYKMLTGITPPQAPELVGSELPAPEKPFSAPVAETIRRSMAVLPENRPANVGEFMSLLQESHTVVMAPPAPVVGEPIKLVVGELVKPVEEKPQEEADQDESATVPVDQPVAPVEVKKPEVVEKPAVKPSPTGPARPVKKSHAGIYIGLAALFLALAAGIFFLVRHVKSDDFWGRSDREEVFNTKMAELSGDDDWTEESFTQEDWESILDEAVEEMNQNLPTNINGITFNFAVVDKDKKGLYYYYLIDEDDWSDFYWDAEMTGYDDMKSSIVTGLIEEARKNDDSTFFMQVIDKAGYDLYIVYYESENYEMEIYTIDPQEVLSKL